MYRNFSIVLWGSVLLCLFGARLTASSSVRPLSARVAASGGLGVLYADAWSLYHNPARLDEVETWQLGIQLCHPYGIQELSTRTIAGTLPVADQGTVGLAYAYFGYPVFSQQKGSLAYARTIHRISFGLTLHYHLRQVYGSDTKQGITAEAGCFVPLSDEWVMGFVYDNILNQSLFDEDPDARIRTGLGFRYAPGSLVGLELDKQTSFPFAVKCGVEHALGKILFLRAGYQLLSSVYSFGLGFSYRVFRIELAFMTHERLGYSPFFSALYMPSQRVAP